MEDGGSSRLNSEYPPPHNVMEEETKQKIMIFSGLSLIVAIVIFIVGIELLVS